MLIIGERINSTRPKIQEAIRSRNASYIVREAASQLKAGAGYIDINCAVTSGDELQDMDWAISVLQSELPDISICVDSPNYLAIERALKVYKAKGAIFINSITGEEERIAKITPLAIRYSASLIALTMDSSGMPNTAEERMEIARKIAVRVGAAGFDMERLYFDALIRPISTEAEQAREFLRSIPMIKSLGRVKTICGLSNVSFGLPARGSANAAFLSMAMHAGLDAAILDPTDAHISSAIAASEALLGTDEYCAGYIRAFRSGLLK